MTGVVERLHALLVDAVSTRRGGDPSAAPVSVAEIYQELVPYRAVRAALGLEMNADYEHVLLRLLSGESGLARLEPATARDQLHDELASPNPNVTLYRKFAGCDVWLAPAVAPPDWVTTHLVDEEPPEEWEGAEPEEDALGWAVAEADAAPGNARAQASMAAPAPDRAPAERRASGREQEARATAARVPDAGRCAFCDSALPAERPVRFCPYCGADQSLHPCPACGEAMEPGWAFCVACGASAETGA